MSEIGVRELKARASEIIRAVRDRRARYIVTYRGRRVGLLVPLESVEAEVVLGSEQGRTVWEELVRLGEEIGRGWQSPQTSTDLLADLRR